MNLQLSDVLEILSRRSLTRLEAERAFTRMLSGGWSDVGMGGFLGALKARGETAEELAGAALALRRAARPFPRPRYLFADTCGTGGDRQATLNVSTAAALVCAEMGIPVAKHGNRSSTSRCGSADVLEALGARLDPDPEASRRGLDRHGHCFLFAPFYHETVRRAMPVRRALGTGTIFNVLGPLANPARPPVQLVGVFDPALCRPVAEALGLLGARAALVVHGDGLDEIAMHGPTHAVLWRNRRFRDIRLTPAAAGVRPGRREDLHGGGPGDNAAALMSLLEGHGIRAYRDAVCLNAGAVAWIAGKAGDPAAGAARARDVLASGRAAARLRRWVEETHHA